MFKPVHQKTSSVYEKVVAELKAKILQGELKPGDRLPGERELSEKLGVSRTSLRESLKMLSASGLVNIRHGQGVFIAENDPEHYLKQFASVALAGHDTIKDMFEMRRLLEGQAAYWAAQRCNEETVRELFQIVTDARQVASVKPTKLLELAELDHKFHNSLAKATGNKVLLRLMYNLLDLMTDVRAHSLSIPGRAARSVEDHYRIALAIQERNNAAAQVAMYSHLDGVERSIFQTFAGTELGG
ncbi:hypothetical protein SY88_12355 [Clostridiales bacterium PH28_bin88]|nr:hypothetical protein SY88_12355 [Clostridiales bacterium PH28_bin88]